MNIKKQTIMKTTVSTEQLFLFSVQAPLVPPKEIVKNPNVVDRLTMDLFPSNLSAYAYLIGLFPELKPALDKFSGWLEQSNVDRWLEYQQILSKIEELVSQHQLSQGYELPVRRSVYFYLALLSEIPNFPGYPYEKVRAACKNDYPQVPENMLATFIGNKFSSYSLQRLGFCLKNWYHRNLPPEEVLEQIKWKFKFHIFLEPQLKALQEKYGLPDFFEV